MERIRDFVRVDDALLSIEVPYESELRWWDDGGEHVEPHTDNLAAIDAYLSRVDDWLDSGAVPMGPWVTYYKPGSPDQAVQLPTTPLLSTRVDDRQSDETHPSLSDALVAMNRWIDARQKEGYRVRLPTWEAFEKPGHPWVEACSKKHCGFHHEERAELEFGPELHLREDGTVSSALIQVQTQAHGHRWAFREGGTLGYIDTSHRSREHGELFLFHKNGLLKVSRREGATRTLHFIAFSEAGALDVRMLDGMDEDGERMGTREEFFDGYIVAYEFNHGVMLSRRRINADQEPAATEQRTERTGGQPLSGPVVYTGQREGEADLVLGGRFQIRVYPSEGWIRAADCGESSFDYPRAMFGPLPLENRWDEDLARLAALASGSPSRTDWLVLCVVLERLYRQDPTRWRREALPLARAVTDWPAALRMAPWLWINKLITYALPVEVLELISALSLTPALMEGWRQARAPMLLHWLSRLPEDAPALAGLHLSMRGEVLRQILFAAEEAEARFRPVRAPDVPQHIGGGALEAILASPLARSLRVLDVSFDEPPWDYLRDQPGPLEGRTVSLARISALLQEPERLEILDLQGNALRSEHAAVPLPGVRAFNACESSPPTDDDLRHLAATLPGLEALAVVPHCVGWLIDEPWPDDEDLQQTLARHWGVTAEDALTFTTAGLTALLALPLQRLTLQDAYEDNQSIQAALESASNLEVDYTRAHGGYVARNFHSDWGEHFTSDSV